MKESNGRYISIVDDEDVKKYCGIMQHAFKKVTIGNFGLWWNENGATIDLHFFYEHIDGGSNGAEFCVIAIENDFVKII